MDISSLRQEITKDMSMLPDFIKTTSFLDHAVWNNMRYINDGILIELLNNKILTERKISVIVTQFYMEIGVINDIYDNVESVNDYYHELLDYMLERSLDEELFEVAANVRNFYTQYKNLFQF